MHPRNLSDEDLLILHSEIDKENMCWNFDEQQADPIHKSVHIRDVLQEYQNRHLMTQLGLF